MDTKQAEALRLANILRGIDARSRFANERLSSASDALENQHARITDLESQLAQRFDAADMATAAAQGFRDGVASVSAGSEPADTVVLNAAMRAIQQAIELIGAPTDERMRAVRRVLRGSVIVAEDATQTLRASHGQAPAGAAQAADSVQEDAADPLQGAANWLAEAHGQFSPVVLSGCLMIGYNRAKRLHDAALAARKQGASR